MDIFRFLGSRTRQDPLTVKNAPTQTNKSFDKSIIFKCKEYSFVTKSKELLTQPSMIHQDCKYKCRKTYCIARRTRSLNDHTLTHKRFDELPKFNCNE